MKRNNIEKTTSFELLALSSPLSMDDGLKEYQENEVVDEGVMIE